ncbi:aminoacyl-tRNA hydrolase [bacterium]|nr:aminoacyl-tRNA hydrolase [bacterium]
MFVVVGLGNPGARYRNTRHNVGVCCLEQLAAKLQTPKIEKWTNQHGAFIYKVNSYLPGVDLLLVRGDCYMNESGGPVSQILNFYKIPPEQLIVTHDDLDLAPGRLKIKRGGSSGGHNGLSDIDEKIGSAEYFRIRIGIGHPRDSQTPEMPVKAWVLASAGSEDSSAIDSAITRAVIGIETLIKEGLEPAQSAINT